MGESIRSKHMFGGHKEISKNVEALLAESNNWIEKNNGINEEIDLMISAFKEIQSAIPLGIIEAGEELSEEFIPPWFYLISEAEQELESARVLMIIGMYKDSLRALRSFIELNIFAIYCFTKKDRKKFIDWLAGNIETPSKSHLLDELVKENNNIQKLDSQLKWVIAVKTLYKDLSKFVHTQGLTGSFLSLRGSNQIVFDEKGLNFCLQTLKRSINLVSQGLVANFTMALQSLPVFEKFAFTGPVGGFLDYGQTKKVESLFSKKQLEVLKKISNTDQETRSLVGWVNSLKDLSGEEVLQSFERGIDTFPDQKEKLKGMLDEGKIEEAFLMLLAIQKAFIGATTLVMNEIYLGIERTSEGPKIKKE